MKTTLKAIVAAGLIGATSMAHAVVTYNYDNSSPVNVPGLTGFQTDGDDMDGMSITAVFGGGSETVAWGTTGPDAGGAFGTNWDLTLSGDTFEEFWSFSNSTGDELLMLILDGAPGLTVFDISSRDNPLSAGSSTPGSASGVTFTDPGIDVTANYSAAVGVGGAAPVGDLYHVLSLDFGSAGTASSFRFKQDTDNDSRRTQVPAPAAVALIGMGLIGFGAARRFRA